MSSLAEQISNLANPTPVFLDPETIEDETAAKLTDKFEEGSSLGAGEPRPSKLRQKTAHLLAESDTKYRGRKVSRKQLEEEAESLPHLTALGESSSDDEDVSDKDAVLQSESENDDVTESDDYVIQGHGDDSDSNDDVITDDEDALSSFQQEVKLHEPDHSTEQQKHFSFADDGDYGQYGGDDDEGEEEDSEDDDDDEDTDGSEDEEEEKTSSNDAEADEGGVQSFTQSNVEAEVLKGRAVKAQLGVWDGVLEDLIRLHKVQVIVNQLPQPCDWNTFVNEGGEACTQALAEGQKAMKILLDQLVDLQTELLRQNPDTKRTVSMATTSDQKLAKITNSAEDDDDEEEEVTSDEEMKPEQRQLPPQSKQQQTMATKRKLKMDDYPQFLAKRHTDFHQFRDETIQKWSDKTRVASGKLSKGFSAFEQSSLKQIEQILGDKERLIRRTQLKRSAYRVLGKEEAASAAQQDEEEEEDAERDDAQERLPSRDHLKNYDEEIFDDDDFYHQLLRELIQQKTVNVNDPVALSRQWLEIQKLRSKVKKKVDTRASKGRKTRYNVHPKLVNFMAPVDRCDWTDEARDELYRSLFGKPGMTSTSETMER